MVRSSFCHLEHFFFFSRTNNAIHYHYQYQGMPQALMNVLDDLCFTSLQQYEMEENGQLSFLCFRDFYKHQFSSLFELRIWGYYQNNIQVIQNSVA